MRCRRSRIEPPNNDERKLIMKDNRTGQVCEKCNSHIIVYRENGKLVYECSYCGLAPEEIENIDFEAFDD